MVKIITDNILILSKVHFLGDVCIKYNHPFCIFILNKLIVFIYSNNLITVGIYNMLKLLYINSIILSNFEKSIHLLFNLLTCVINVII